MIYKSKKKVKDITENYDKSHFPKITSASFGGYLELEIPTKNRIQMALSILKKQNKYHEKLTNDFLLGHYYVINGNMSYIGFEVGSNRALEDKSFIKRLSDEYFFADDRLVFQILSKVESNERDQLIIKCIVENLECFTGYNIDHKMIFSKNTLDPGILEKKIPITGVVRIDNIDKEQRVCYGNPLYLKANYD